MALSMPLPDNNLVDSVDNGLPPSTDEMGAKPSAIFGRKSDNSYNITAEEEVKCTVQELEDILTAPCGGIMMLPGEAYDLVWPGIYIGEEETARDIHQLRLLKITHILNCAEGRPECYCVDTGPEYYSSTRMKYLGLEAIDLLNCDLSQYFAKAALFIKTCLDENGIVYVHCRQGVSRSATIVLSYLMLYQHLTLQESTRAVREKREVCPNSGFMQQLCDFNEKLHQAGHYTNGDLKS